ncbi:16S rRNA (cytosine(967)-C(5))-methyltransferase RsmB [Simiduia sp. 21SJ11W-1]|uniref:16S rRNA (cytosine(967)-C(5))-methyltransferase RsmB n=1 Tax=Simiduia sp. 21SJ11W-1 TaxID=2909669 RepID=UPI00209C7770|nr:16S rRNA (cytosine(967)-C(5))-methyltransferase RsmB [Simiduia sp. 21SJ11W-1]UTA47924.1 16S rRNA (cytosine(967)-C(5))-methyltransferase RsmB [Simiduia sp. 21SJ11W-1]
MGKQPVSKNSRALAAQALAEVLNNGQSLATVLPRTLARTPERDRGLVSELCYGGCRWFHRYNPVIQQLLSKAFKPKDTDLLALLLLGIYQLEHMRVPDHAALSNTVEACRALKKDWATKLINGVLRNFQRNKKQLLADAYKIPGAEQSHPRWIHKALSQHWGDAWASIEAANNAHPPLALRVGAGLNRADYQQTLAEAGIKAAPGALARASLVLESALDVTQLPGFDSAQISVQDEAAQLAGELLPVPAGGRVLDSCCAPGGKTLHLLQNHPDISLVAVDADAGRLTRVQENLDRGGLHAQLITGDASQPSQWWDGNAFDAILLDAPCSATGVIRRHPDIKLLRKPADIDKLAALQGQIVAALWPLLAPGGHLLYATCSVMPQENTQVMEAFLAAHPKAREVPLPSSWGIAQPAGRQLLPGAHNSDGFYYCLVQKTA